MTDETSSDESLFAAYRSGDMAAFDVLYGRYRQPLYLFMLRRGHGEMTAEDVFHDSWMKIIDHKDRFEGGSFRAWIYHIARNVSTDYFRKSQLRTVQPLDEAQTEQQQVSTQRQQEAEDCVELIKHSIAALPMEQKDAFLLKQEAGLSMQQIAELMAVGRETIKSRLRYAMKSLKQLMADCL